MTLGQLWDAIYFTNVSCGVRPGRYGVTVGRLRVYDYDDLALRYWKHWTKR